MEVPRFFSELFREDRSFGSASVRKCQLRCWSIGHVRGPLAASRRPRLREATMNAASVWSTQRRHSFLQTRFPHQKSVLVGTQSMAPATEVLYIQNGWDSGNIQVFLAGRTEFPGLYGEMRMGWGTPPKAPQVDGSQVDLKAWSLFEGCTVGHLLF